MEHGVSRNTKTKIVCNMMVILARLNNCPITSADYDDCFNAWEAQRKLYPQYIQIAKSLERDLHEHLFRVD